MLANLIPKLRARFGSSAAQCGASSSVVQQCDTIDVNVLQDILNDARLEYSIYQPYEDILTLNVQSFNPVITLPYEPHAVTGVFTSAPDYMFPHVPSTYLANYYADPALGRVDDTYLDYATPEVNFTHRGRLIRITSAIPDVVRAEVHLTRMRQWSEMPEWAEPILLKIGVVYLIDRTTTDSGTLLRIPTPNGYFEFDGGKIMQNLRNKLWLEAHQTLTSNTHGIIQG